MKIHLGAQDTVDLIAWALEQKDKLPKGYAVETLRVDYSGCVAQLKKVEVAQ